MLDKEFCRLQRMTTDACERRRIIDMVGPAGLHHSRNINHLGRTETLGNSDVSPCLSQSNVSAHPPDIPKTRGPRNGGNRARANRNTEALNSFNNTENLQLIKAKLQQRFGLLPATAAVIAELAFVAGCSR